MRLCKKVASISPAAFIAIEPAATGPVIFSSALAVSPHLRAGGACFLARRPIPSPLIFQRTERYSAAPNEPAVTPSTAPAAAKARVKRPAWSSPPASRPNTVPLSLYSAIPWFITKYARPRPRHSLTAASIISDTAVGPMFLSPS